MAGTNWWRNRISATLCTSDGQRGPGGRSVAVILPAPYEQVTGCGHHRSLRQQTGAPGDRRGLGATARAELGEHVGDVHADRLRADEQLSSDLAVAAALRHQTEDLLLARGERGVA